MTTDQRMIPYLPLCVTMVLGGVAGSTGHLDRPFLGQSDPRIAFVEISRLTSGSQVRFSGDLRVMGGAGDAFVSGLDDPFQWVRVQPSSGEASLFEAPRGDLPGFFGVSMATGSAPAGQHYAFGNDLLAVFSADGTYRSGRFLGGDPLVAEAAEDGSARAVVSRSIQGGWEVSVVSIGRDGEISSRRVVDHPFPQETWRPRRAFLWTSGAFITNAREPYEILRVNWDGTVRDTWIRHGSWNARRTDEFGRLAAMILGIHEFPPFILVVSAVRKAEARGTYGGDFEKFHADNDFFLEVIDPGSGLVLSTTVHDRPPFYGGVSPGVVYRIDEDPDTHVVAVVFLEIHQEMEE